MTNPLPPKQRWLTRWALKSGVVTDLITELTPEEVTHKLIGYLGAEHGFMETPPKEVLIEGVNEKNWPVYLVVRPDEVVMRVSTPHEVYLAARPKIVKS